MIEISHDDDCPDPREACSNLGLMVCFHRRYTLGDTGGRRHHACGHPQYQTPEELDAFMKQERVLALPLYLYVHSGITMKTSPFSCPWDSGQVGYIYVTPSTVRHEYNRRRITADLRCRVLDYLRDEVATYDAYISGDCYEYVVRDPVGEEIGRCAGFYGSDHKASGLMESAESEIRFLAQLPDPDRRRQACRKGMSRYTSGWAWHDQATEEQMTAGSEAQCDAYASEISRLYTSLPDDSDRDDERRAACMDVAYEISMDTALSNGLSMAEAHKAAEAELKQIAARQAAARQLVWDQIEFFEQKLDLLGARLRRPYEHWNEHEQLMAHLEGDT